MRSAGAARPRDARARWRVAVWCAEPGSTEALAAAVRAGGGEVVQDVAAAIDGPAPLGDAAPEVVVWQPARSRATDLELLRAVDRPVVLFTRDTSRAAMDAAVRAGVMACLVEPLQPTQLGPTLDLAVARFRDAALLRQRLADRKLIERAKGQVMAHYGLSEEHAYRWLRTRAMDSRSRMRDVAAEVLAPTAASPRAAAERLPARAAADRSPARAVSERFPVRALGAPGAMRPARGAGGAPGARVTSRRNPSPR